MSGRDFWSRRRAGVAAEAAEEARAGLEAERAAGEAALAARRDDEILEDLN